jgi:hypothetical protein
VKPVVLSRTDANSTRLYLTAYVRLPVDAREDAGAPLEDAAHPASVPHLIADARGTPAHLLSLPMYIFLDTYMPSGVYKPRGIYIRSDCGAESPGDTDPFGLVTTVGW